MRPATYLELSQIAEVSIHAPAWGATRRTLPASRSDYAFQSTHPRGVRHVDHGATVHYVLLVSIHAPAWGATSNGQAGCASDRRFNPRTRVGCDSASSTGCSKVGRFNPRTRVGCDRLAVRPLIPWKLFQSTHPRGVRPALFAFSVSSEKVSIHAPAWGATHPARVIIAATISFNPRTRVGCDLCTAQKRMSWRCFNPRTRVGCDRTTKLTCQIASGFNPRTRVGCDQLDVGAVFFRNIGFNPRTRVGCDACCVCTMVWYRSVSIHAPAWGATRKRPSGLPAGRPVSIHAPAWGATTRAGRTRPWPRCFNPRTRVGCDWPLSGCAPCGRSFNPRTRVGCDVSVTGWGTVSVKFQSTHPRGVRPADPWPPARHRSSFNPRTRVGCDAYWTEGTTSAFRFNPRTRVGCDCASRRMPDRSMTFQSTHPRGVRRR